MKFDFAIGNPPYQESRDTTKDMPVYNDFMEAAYKVADKVELITPARFLFNAGATPKAWNESILKDEHFKVLDYEANSSTVFSNTDIKGGIAIHYRDSTKSFGCIETFTAFQELKSLKDKMKSRADFISLNTIMYPYSTYTLSDALWDDYPERKQRVEYVAKNRNKLSKEEKEGELSNLRIITTNIFDLLPELFFEKKPKNNKEYACLIGRQNNQRCHKYILKKYIDVAENYEKWKIILPAGNGCGALGEVLSTPLVGQPLVGQPLVGYTQTFLGIGSVETELEAKAIYKYICSKFCRAMLGILKITQHNPPEKWAFVPLQNFTAQSDIDWSKTIADIDKQLYKKYGLSQEEIDFIETHVKEME